MNNFHINIFFTILFLFFSGCAQKEFITERYYKGFTKDEILNAGKLSFKDTPNSEYIVDSYRDKLEVTKIEIIFNTLDHMDYLFNVEEDNCGTNASLKVTTSYGMLKNLKHNSFEFEHNNIWNRIDYFLGKKDEVYANGSKFIRDENLNKMFINYVQNITNKKVIKPTKDLSECIINDEFNSGVIQDKIDDEIINEIK